MLLQLARSAPIGVFDSGVGGLTVWQALRQLLPHEQFIYIADNRHAPYGEQAQAFILQRSLGIAEFFRQQTCKALVIACNTATAAAGQGLRERWPEWPIIGIEPAVKPAAMLTQSGKIGILATTNTLASEKFQSLVQRFAGEVQVFSQPCPGLVELIEAGDLNHPALNDLLQQYVQQLLAKNCDVVVLGCTHYPLVQTQIQTLVGPNVAVIETGGAVAREVLRQLTNLDLLSAPQQRSNTTYLASGEPHAMATVLGNLGIKNPRIGLYDAPD